MLRQVHPALSSRCGGIRAKSCLQRKISLDSRKHEPHLFRSRPIQLISATVGIAAAAYFFSPWNSRGVQTSESTPLSPSHFIPVAIASSAASGPNTKLLTVVVPPHLLPPYNASTLAPIWSVYIKDDDIQVERPYTPLEGIDKDGCMKFWIKKYANGEVGRWLHSKNIGDSIEIRGPLRTWEWREGVWDEIVMISGGTGITPFYQLFHTVISKSVPSKTRFTLLHSSRTTSELPPPSIVRSLDTFAKKFPDHFRFHLFVDSANEPPPPDYQLHVRRIDKIDIQKYGLDHERRSWWPRFLAPSDTGIKNMPKVLFLVCGPNQMVDAIAGPFGRNFSQGDVGGILGDMGYTSHEVHKLL